uniref:Putative myosuppressin receptor V n=1 Tax=Homarus americanus TaxID=6706 RepID=A0A7G7X488_HOMAM|nr:putative myosuppressin receptor V [Homarus americanus]
MERSLPTYHNLSHQGDTSIMNGTVNTKELMAWLLKNLPAFNLSDKDRMDTVTALLGNDNVSSNITEEEDDFNQQYCQFNFKEQYKWLHYRLAVCIAVTGAIANFLTVSTLTRRNMATPTNLLLLGLAVADLLVEVEYIPYATSTLIGGDQIMEAKEHALYVLVHAHLSQVCHTIAIWLTVSLALWRWVAVCRPHAAPTVCTMLNARRVMLVVYFACPALAMPTFFMYAVKEVSNDDGSKVYYVDFSSFALAHNELLKKINLLVFSVVVKLIPCVLLTLLLPAIIRGMWVAKRRRQRLVCRRPSGVVTTTNGAANNNTTRASVSRSSYRNKLCGRRSVSVANGTDQPKTHKKGERRDSLFAIVFTKGATERTTSMLLVVMLLFLLTEAPNGVLTGLSLVYGHDFFNDCYIQLGDFMDLLALINSAINFVLYCVMSEQFRGTFVSIYCNCCKKDTPESQAPTRTNTKNCKVLNTKI